MLKPKKKQNWISLFDPDEPVEQEPKPEQWYTDQLLALQEEYPEGAPASNTIGYQWVLDGGIFSFDHCASFCGILSDRIFGKPKSGQNKNGVPVWYQKISRDFPFTFVPASEANYDFENLMPTDILFFEGHVVMVVSVDRINETVRVCESYYQGKIWWSRVFTKEAIENSAQYLLTRFDKVNGRPLPNPDPDPDPDPEPHDCRISQFEDMEDYPYGTDIHAAVEWAFTHNPQLTAGTDATHFSPEMVVTRATIMTFLWAASGKPEPQTTKCPFTDVKPGKWYTKAVLWAYENNITSGKTDGTFGINDKCKVTHMLTFLYAQQGRPDFDASAVPAGYVAEGKYYTQAVKWAYVRQIERADSGVFDSSAFCSRATAELFLYRTLEGMAPDQD